MDRDEQPWIDVISDGYKHVAFCPTTMAASAVDDATRAALAVYAKRGDIASAAKSVGMAQRDFEQLVQKLVTAAPELELQSGCSSDSDEEETPPLDRLVLHVSNDCNLRCLYCYADGGSYGRPRGDMPRGVAFTAINWTIRTFGGVRVVQFFGGEPLLNPRLLIEVCEYFKTLKGAGKIKELPQFAMVTNGTLGDERIIKLLRRYEIAVTISIDGPELVHDALRGKGSFEKADRFARQCLQVKGVRTDFECTWTPIHVNEGVSIVDLIDFFYERYGMDVLHVVPVSAPPTSALHLDPEVRMEAFKEAAQHTVRTLAAGKPRANSLSQRVLEALRKKKPMGLYCPAGIGTLSVAADGGVYPCFMFAGNDSFRICRFSPDGRVHENRIEEMSAILKACDKSTREECLSCWAAPLCSGCIGGDFIETGEMTQRPSCSTVCKIAETVLLEVAAV